MKLIKTLAAVAISSALLTGCVFESDNDVIPVSEVSVATFNLSFDRFTFEQLVDEMQTTPSAQQALVDGFIANTLSADDKAKALKIIQIRNVAAIIQSQRPDIILLAEYNNDGTGDDLSALKGFQDNYLSVGQSLNSIDGGDTLSPIHYPFAESYATNTGLMSGLDLNNDGKVNSGPNDAWGFGQYHGQYAFALMSQFKIDNKNTRTFQTFKWKDLPTATMPVINNCDDEKNKIPAGMSCGDNWYSDAEWQQLRLSSKNHVDAPVIIPTPSGDQVVHILMSHPTPPVFDTVTENNKLKNRDEIQFWTDYIDGAEFIYDDKGTKGGLADNAKFVIVGDLNADPEAGDGFIETIDTLLKHQRVNQEATNGAYVPTSFGAEYCFPSGECRQDNPHPDRLTSTFGLQVDHAIPSSNLNIVDSGVYWPAPNEAGYLLMNDKRIGKGKGKDISSDHRMVWLKARFN
ncbi:endonuclease/exonuclease/phosphatase family protein [Photobacterium leiognathi]|uniref:endonuclease/exonuclease/phosphatase family protein n=1 Tax=Photobacterium leiognathi TaxID=553611 RepID=UPI0029821608|nr:endonuclease/exonuclease/phosphatase family protein [Photobacterium leiognathi]